MAGQAREYIFGSGQLYCTPVAAGVLGSPVKVGTLQDVSFEITGDVKELHGQYGLPVAVGRGKEKVSIKAGNGDVDVRLYNSIFFGEASGANGITTGSFVQALDEAGTVPAMSTYTITVANSMHFYRDLGVYDSTIGKQLSQVPSMPATGQYSVSAGVYTFNSANASDAVTINYIYTATAGTTLTMNNHLIGTQPFFELNLMETFDGNWLMVQFNKVLCHKLSQPLKLDDFSLSDLEMSAQVDSSGVLGLWSTTV